MAKITWAFDPSHSELGFKIKHLMISTVSGSFADFTASVETENDDFSTASITATIQAASVTTNNKQRDEHLQHGDFFETDRFPEITFRSTKIDKVDGEQFTVHGDLTLKGITKNIKLNVEYNGLAKDPYGNHKAGFTINTKIIRSEFGLNFNSVLDTGGVALSDEVKVHGEVQLGKQIAELAATA
jgi:polyisoprenoid-binding protein YceI